MTNEKEEEPVTALPSEEPLRPALGQYLLEHADQRGWIGNEPPAIAVALKADLHAVVHVLWDFQKQGHLKFRQTKATQGKSQSNLTGLRLTSTGRRFFATTGSARLAVDRASEHARPGGRGIGTVAPGGPVAIVAPDGTTTMREPAVEPPVDPVYREVQRETAEALGRGQNPWLEPERDIPDGIALGVTPYLPVPAEYPVITSLLGRQDDLIEAASLLERAGQPELAQAALERAEAADTLYSPIEAEAVRLWRAITGR